MCILPALFLVGCILLLQAGISYLNVLPYYCLAGVFLIQILAILIYRWNKDTIKLFTLSLNNFNSLSEGKIILDTAFGQSAISKEFNALQVKVTKYYSDLQEIALKIANGNLEISYQPKTSDDILGSTLVHLKDKLIKISEDEKAGSWSSNGIAEFVTLLREETDSIKLCNTVLSFIIKYVNANQGTIYLLDKNESGEELFTTAAMYAYGRKKHITQEILPGEGLIGQCYYEREIIFITDVPQNYIKITSGLGEALPRCIVLMPLLYNDELQGVIELASFQVWNDYEINFLKRIAEYLASTLSGLKVTQQTRKLLEKADHLNQELNNRSEEMRLNMEELRATQEEIERKNLEFTGLYLAVNQTMVTADITNDGIILKVNSNFSSLFELQVDSFEGKYLHEFLNSNNSDINFLKILDKVSKGESFEGVFLTNSLIDNKWISGTFSPMKDESQKVVRILFLATDISKEKKLQLDTMSQADELNKKMNEIEAERKKNLAILEGCVDGVLSFDSKGNVNFFNKAAEEIWGTNRNAVVGNHIKRLVPLEIEVSDTNTNVYYTNNESTRKELSVRTEVSFLSSKGESVDALMTLTSATLGNEVYFTCFVQNISVDLF